MNLSVNRYAYPAGQADSRTWFVIGFAYAEGRNDQAGETVLPVMEFAEAFTGAMCRWHNSGALRPNPPQITDIATAYLNGDIR